MTPLESLQRIRALLVGQKHYDRNGKQNVTYAGDRLNADGKLAMCFLEQDAKVVPNWD